MCDPPLAPWVAPIEGCLTEGFPCAADEEGVEHLSLALDHEGHTCLAVAGKERERHGYSREKWGRCQTVTRNSEKKKQWGVSAKLPC